MRTLGFTPLPAWMMAVLIAIVCFYVLAAEVAKKYFYAHAQR